MLRWLKNMLHTKRRKTLRVGDIAPEGPISGAMVAVDPQTNRITAIFIP